ncbi:AAA family ATPase [Pseudomonas sp. S3_E11]
MSHVNSFGVRNLRSFGEETQLVPIKKINMFVGRNSCGKSTFLRTYPLLRQSVESNTRSPILWYGSYVDFGDLTTAVHDGSDKIFFDFNCELDIETNFSDKYLYESQFYNTLTSLTKEIMQVNVDISIGLNLRKDKQVQSNSIITIGNTEIIINYCAGQVQDMVCTQYSQDSEHKQVNQLAFSNLYITSKGSILPTNIYGIKDVTDAQGRIAKHLDEETIKKGAQQALISYLKKYTSTTKSLSQKLEQLKLVEIKKLGRELTKIFSTDKKFHTHLKEMANEIQETVFFYLIIRNFPRILTSADRAFKGLFSGVRYLGPVRASAERFYRHQDLEIGEVDHKGENLPMVINSLDARMKNNLSKWISDNFGFELELEASGLHYELKIKEEHDAKFHNISDMGFGYSQILPVIVSIWLETVGAEPRRRYGFVDGNSRTLVIEQPELHLHPALQYRFGLAIAKVVSLATNIGFRIVIETHSSQMIEAIGESIRRGVIADSDICIALFEKNKNDCTEITMSGFDDEGYLMNWPAGFLSA